MHTSSKLIAQVIWTVFLLDRFHYLFTSIHVYEGLRTLKLLHHCTGKSVLCTLSSSDGIEVDLTGSTSPWAFFKLTDAVVVGNSGRGMYIQGTDSNQVSIESCVSLWNDGADYEWGGTAHHSQTVKSSIFKNCQSTFNRHSGGASRSVILTLDILLHDSYECPTPRILILCCFRYRENILDQTARQSRKAHKKKPHAPLSAGLGNQVMKLSRALN